MAGVMRDEELDLLHNAELKEAFDEFDKVEIVEYFDFWRIRFISMNVSFTKEYANDAALFRYVKRTNGQGFYGNMSFTSFGILTNEALCVLIS